MKNSDCQGGYSIKHAAFHPSQDAGSVVNFKTLEERGEPDSNPASVEIW